MKLILVVLYKCLLISSEIIQFPYNFILFVYDPVLNQGTINISFFTFPLVNRQWLVTSKGLSTVRFKFFHKYLLSSFFLLKTCMEALFH